MQQICKYRCLLQNKDIGDGLCCFECKKFKCSTTAGTHCEYEQDITEHEFEDVKQIVERGYVIDFN